MTKKKTNLIIGKFYHIYGGSPHPALIVAYNSEHKTYLAIKFGTTRGKHMTRINPIQHGYLDSFVHNRPFEGTRDDFGNRELDGIAIDEIDAELIEQIKTRVPKQTKRAKKHYEK